jgi:hypothetical protein
LHPKPNNQACKNVAAISPDCKCETETVCIEHSPGPIKDDEVIIRFIRNNEGHYDSQTGEILPGAFEEVCTRGLSVIRRKFATDEQIKKQQVNDGHVGYLEVEVKTIRDFKHSPDPNYNTGHTYDVRIFGVYDTALENNTAHADICQCIFWINPSQKRESFNIRLRKKLKDAFGKELRSFVQKDDNALAPP